MSEEERRTIILEPSAELTPRVGFIFSMMQKIRERTLRRLGKISAEKMDYSPHGRNIETIGTLFLHIAAVEWSWIFEDVGDTAMDYEKWKHAFPLREYIDQLTGQSKEFYIDRLNEVRNEVFEWLKTIDDDTLNQLVHLGDTDVNIEWVLFHIIEHEAMHVGQISILSRMYDMTNVKVDD
jgi:uncharacterized damage-inducible protein DinB